jgi:hypothetical protein
MVAMLPAAGCSVGPTVLATNRAGYNVAAQRSASEQLLLNMVRLKYREPMLFLQIGSITSHFNYSADATVSGTFPEGAADTHGAGLGASVSEQPTLSYTPLEGKAFANRILTETDMGTFTLLVRGGWNIDILMRTMVERLGPMRNYPAASEPGAAPTPYERFLELTRLWRASQRAGNLRFLRLSGDPVTVADDVPAEEVTLSSLIAAGEAGYSLQPREDGRYRLQSPGTASLVVAVAYPDAETADRADALLGVEPERTVRDDGTVRELLRLTASHDYYAREPDAREPNEVPIQLRSYSDLLYYVAQGIEVPAAHEAAGLTKIYRDVHDRPVDRRRFTRDLLDVRCSALAPAGAFVAVPYRGRWFYIADSDTASKDAFTLLDIIFALQSDEKQAGPVLTLPVSG